MAQKSRYQFGPFERPIALQLGVGSNRYNVKNSQPRPPTKNKGQQPPKNAGKTRRTLTVNDRRIGYRPPKPKRSFPTYGYIPTYISIATHAAVAGVGDPGHFSPVTLSAAAIAAGATIVFTIRDEAMFFGVPEMYGLTVLKFPKPVSGTAFTVTLSGTNIPDPYGGPDPSQFCGHYEMSRSITPTGDPLGIEYRDVGTQTTPDGTTSWDQIITLSPAEYQTWLTNQGLFNFSRDSISFYNGDGNLVDTALPCTDTPTKILNYPFDDFRVYINPQQDHVVSNPGWPYDPTDAVRPNPALYPGLFGNSTFLWYVDLGDVPDNGAINFAFISRPYTVARPTTPILEIFPTTARAGARYDYFGTPKFRLMNSPYVGTPSIDVAWSSTFNPGASHLYWGSPPFLLQYDPGP